MELAWQKSKIVLELQSYPQVHTTQKPDSGKILNKQLYLG